MTIDHDNCCDIEGEHTMCHFKKQPPSIWSYICLILSVSGVILVTGLYVIQL